MFVEIDKKTSLRWMFDQFSLWVGTRRRIFSFSLLFDFQKYTIIIFHEKKLKYVSIRK